VVATNAFPFPYRGNTGLAPHGQVETMPIHTYICNDELKITSLHTCAFVASCSKHWQQCLLLFTPTVSILVKSDISSMETTAWTWL